MTEFRASCDGPTPDSALASILADWRLGDWAATRRARTRLPKRCRTPSQRSPRHLDPLRRRPPTSKRSRRHRLRLRHGRESSPHVRPTRPRPRPHRPHRPRRDRQPPPQLLLPPRRLPGEAKHAPHRQVRRCRPQARNASRQGVCARLPCFDWHKPKSCSMSSNTNSQRRIDRAGNREVSGVNTFRVPKEPAATWRR